MESINEIDARINEAERFIAQQKRKKAKCAKMSDGNEKPTEQQKKAIENSLQRLEHIDGLDSVILQLQEELKQKQTQVVEMENEDWDDEETAGKTGTCMTIPEIQAEFQRHLDKLGEALDAVEFSKDWALDMLTQHGGDDYFIPIGDITLNRFMAFIDTKADKIEVNICRLMDMIRDVESIVVDNNTYPAKKYSDIR